MRTDDLYLVDIIEAADDISRFLQGMTAENSGDDARTRSAIQWKLMILAEAATRISDDTRKTFSDVPWDRIRGLRNRMIHGYFTLDWQVVLGMATGAVPSLAAQAEQILATRFPDTHRRLRERRTGDAG